MTLDPTPSPTFVADPGRRFKAFARPHDTEGFSWRVHSPDQNRETFDEGALGELAESIRELGLLQPVTVRPECGRYVLIAGERRLRAVRMLGWAEIPAIVRESDDDDALRTLVENLVRVDTNPIEDARGLAREIERSGVDAAGLAARLGKSARWVRGRLALLSLADDVAHYVAAGLLPVGRAVVMSELDANRQRLALAAHEHGIGPDAFTGLVAKLLTDQSAETMFDSDSFLCLEEYVMDAEHEAAAVAADKVVRDRPVGITEIAELLEVKPATVDMWRHRGLLPEPEFRISGSPGWWQPTILAWARETGRL